MGKQLGKDSLALAILIDDGAEEDLSFLPVIREVFEEEPACWPRLEGREDIHGWSRQLTYLARTASGTSAQGRKGLFRVRVVGASSQAIQVGSGLTPGQVMDDDGFLSPEDGGAVWNGQDA